jgi:zinc protease
VPAMARLLSHFAWRHAAPLLLAATLAGAQRTTAVRPLAYTRLVLPNGLVAVLNEDHSAPVVAVEVWYKLGSIDEKAGQTGYAHFCEHLMDLSAPHVKPEVTAFLQSIGGTSSGGGLGQRASWATTLQEYTRYYVTVPSNQLEPALWAESDRMAAPLSGADAASFRAQRDVIRQERRSRIDNQPFAAGLAFEVIGEAAFPAGHPYRIGSIGLAPDLESATLERVKSFCLPYYVPNNAVLALSGDFKTAEAKRLITKYFGSIARGAALRHPASPSAPLASERRLVLEDPRARLTTIRFIWPAIGFAHPDKMALYALAFVLSPYRFDVRPAGWDRFGRLSKALVYDRPLATAVDVGMFDAERAGLFVIDVSPRPGASLSAIEAVVDSVVAAVQKDVTPAEVARFGNFNALLGVTSLQARQARTDTLAQGQVWADDPLAYAKQIERGMSLTAADVRRAAKTYLTPGRVVLSIVPKDSLRLISRPDLPYQNATPKPPAAPLPESHQ